MKEKQAVWYASQITVGLEKGLAIDEIGPEGLQLYKKETPRTFSSICATSCFVWRHKTQYTQQNKCGFLLKWRKKKKKTSRICDVLFSMEICKTIQIIDSYTFELKTIFFFC